VNRKRIRVSSNYAQHDSLLMVTNSNAIQKKVVSNDAHKKGIAAINNDNKENNNPNIEALTSTNLQKNDIINKQQKQINKDNKKNNNNTLFPDTIEDFASSNSIPREINNREKHNTAIAKLSLSRKTNNNVNNNSADRDANNKKKKLIGDDDKENNGNFNKKETVGAARMRTPVKSIVQKEKPVAKRKPLQEISINNNALKIEKNLRSQKKAVAVKKNSSLINHAAEPINVED
jgi:hypothetical protein